MGWNSQVSRSEAYKKHIREVAEAVRTLGVEDLKKWRKDLERRLDEIRSGPFTPHPVLGDEEEFELKRMVGLITERVTQLNRRAAGGTDPGREAAEKGTGPLHERLRQAYAELDQVEAAKGDPTDVRGRIARLKKTLDEGGELVESTVPEEFVEVKRRSRRYRAAF